MQEERFTWQLYWLYFSCRISDLWLCINLSKSESVNLQTPTIIICFWTFTFWEFDVIWWLLDHLNVLVICTCSCKQFFSFEYIWVWQLQTSSLRTEEWGPVHWISFWYSTKFSRCRFNANHSALAVIKSVLLMIQLNLKKLRKGYGTLIKSCQRRVKHWHSLPSQVACWLLALASGLSGVPVWKHSSFTRPPAQLEAACFRALSTNPIDAQNVNPYFSFFAIFCLTPWRLCYGLHFTPSKKEKKQHSVI